VLPPGFIFERCFPLTPDDTLEVPQSYCLMWTNTSPEVVELALQFRLTRKK
jgi:hypothetical protein